MKTWLGKKRVAFILTKFSDVAYEPVNWRAAEQTRCLSDLKDYFQTVSYNRADLDGEVFGPYTIGKRDDYKQPDGFLQLAWAMNAGIKAAYDAETQKISTYQYACVIFNMGGGGGHFYAPATPDPGFSLSAASWVQFDSSLGVLAMENTHGIAEFYDLYGIADSPGSWDNMDCSCGTHVSSFTKSKLGWMDPGSIVNISGQASTKTITLHALADRVFPGTTQAIRIPSVRSTGYFLVEARFRSDRYESATPQISSGIPQEGVVVYWIDESSWPPVHLKRTLLFNPGDNFTDSAERVKVEVVARYTGNFVVKITRTARSKIKVRVDPFPVVLDVPTNVTVYANDERDGHQISGTVLIFNPGRRSTDPPDPPHQTNIEITNYTFRQKTVRNRLPDGEIIVSVLNPRGTVTAPGYEDVTFDFVEPVGP